MNYLTDINNVTVYQLVEYVNTTYGTRIEHNKVMTRQMPKLLAMPIFGVCNTITESAANKYSPALITTYLLTKRQATAVATRICGDFLMHVVDRLDMLERKYNETNTQDVLHANVQEQIDAATAAAVITTQNKWCDWWMEDVDPNEECMAIIDARLLANHQHLTVSSILSMQGQYRPEKEQVLIDYCAQHGLVIMQVPSTGDPMYSEFNPVTVSAYPLAAWKRIGIDAIALLRTYYI